MSSKYDRQLALEAECVGLGVARYRKQRPMPWQDKQSRQKDETELPPGQQLLKRLVAPVAAAIQDELDKAAAKKAGRNHIAIPYLRAVSPNQLAFWCEADEPWCALAACFEWAGYVEQGKDWITHLPCHADGSCSGLQHFSGMLLDERGGKAVNLLPAETPQDFYTDTARVAQAYVDQDTDPAAKAWKNGKISRKIANPTEVRPDQHLGICLREWLGHASQVQPARPNRAGRFAGQPETKSPSSLTEREGSFEATQITRRTQ